MHTLKTIAAIGLMALCTGCWTRTGMIFIDRPEAERNGLEVTEFKDNPFYAEIHYDYSKIKDFDESKVQIALQYTPVLYDHLVVDLEEFDNGCAEMYLKVDGLPVNAGSGASLMMNNFMMMKMSMSSTSVFTPCGPHWIAREVDVVERKPGYMKVFSADDIGVYRLTYGEKPKVWHL